MIAVPPGVHVSRPEPPPIEFDGHTFPGRLSPMDLMLLYLCSQARAGDQKLTGLLLSIGFRMLDQAGRQYWPMEVESPTEQQTEVPPAVQVMETGG